MRVLASAFGRWAFVAVFVGATIAPAHAADFYAGKTITIVVGFSPGGTYDQTARFYARHLGRFLAGKPQVVVQNMPGAGSLVATANLYKLAAGDPTRLGIVGGGTVWEPILGDPQAQYDPRQFNWIGGRSPDTITCALWHTTPVSTLDNVKTREVIVGATGPGSRTTTIPKALNELYGTKWKVVSGYPGGNELALAIDKHEIDGYCGWALGAIKRTATEWYETKKLKYVVQFAKTRAPELADVPLATELGGDAVAKGVMEFLTSDSTLSWPMLAPPGIGAERTAELRKAFDDMLADPQVRVEAEREKLEIDPIKGTELQALVEQLYKTPKDVVDLVKKISQGN